MFFTALECFPSSYREVAQFMLWSDSSFSDITFDLANSTLRGIGDGCTAWQSVYSKGRAFTKHFEAGKGVWR